MSTLGLAGLLWRTRQAELRHAAARVPRWAIVLGLGLGLAGALGTIVLGARGYARSGAGANVLAFVLFLWFAGRIGQAAVGQGQGALSPEVFAPLPLGRRRVANALLLIGFADPGLILCALAYTSLLALGVRHGLPAACAGLAGTLLLTALTGVATTVVAGALAAGEQRGRDPGTLVVAVVIAIVSAAGAAVPVVAATLTGPHPGALAAAARALPSGWPAVAVDAAARGHAAAALAALAGLALATAAVAAAWPALLARRMDARARPARRGSEGAARQRLPATPVWAVASKELALWTRAQLRLVFAIVAVLAGLLPVAIAAIEGARTLLPFAGALTLVIAAACAVNLYGDDGPSLWWTASIPDAARADARGRQLAWLLLFGPYSVLLTLALTAAAGTPADWPWLAALLPALLGGGSALAILGSLTAALAPDDDGGPTPAWSLKVHLALLAALAPALPPLALLLAGLHWLAVPAGVFTGVALAAYAAHAGPARLRRRQIELLALVRPSG